MKNLNGNTTGLKTGTIRRLERFYRRRVPAEYPISRELAKDISLVSHDIQRQIGLLIDRSGRVVRVIVGDHREIVIPDVSEFRTAPGRLKGVRCVHTHLSGEPLTSDDLTDLAMLRLDAMVAITLKNDGLPDRFHLAYILPNGTEKNPFQILPPMASHELNIGFSELVRALESELARMLPLFEADAKTERALLVSVTTSSRKKARESLVELAELAKSAGIEVVDVILQLRKKADSRFLTGRGKLQDIILLALRKGANLLIFDQELNPSQIRSITDRIETRVIDRTQLILDIFAQRAKSKEGKLQVELAQLKYMLPRLVTKNTAMSRLTGGIGGRGPGETRLEINRRRVRERIGRLRKALSGVEKRRKQQKALREKKSLPVISIIGYTNAGKSTLLNTLTHSDVLAESRLFATLDPSSRRLRFPKETEVIITDTVGFIRDLPKELMTAFRATLEELEKADLLLHVIDISNPDFRNQIESVNKILAEIHLSHIPRLHVLNKIDKADRAIVEKYETELDGIGICALKRNTLRPLVNKMEKLVG